MLKYVFDFNQNRNKFSYDPETETKMYKEEVEEFYEAKTLSEMLDAYVDCQFVRMGTEMKQAANGLYATLPYFNQESLMYAIMSTTLDSKFTAVDNYGGPVGCNGSQLLDKMISKTQKIVCQSNELKGYNLDKNGKVIKSQDYIRSIKPDELIAKMVKQELLNERE